MKSGEEAEKFLSLERWRESPLYARRERLALEAAEGMTIMGLDVSDELFRELEREFTEDELVELAATIALENYRSKFNHFFRVEANGLCRWEPQDPRQEPDPQARSEVPRPGSRGRLSSL